MGSSVGVARQAGERSLLVLSYHFPPDGAVGGLRWAGLTKYLVQRGWTIHVITAAPAPDGAEHAGVFVHRVPRVRTLDEVYRSWKESRGFVAQAGAARSAAADSADDVRGGGWLRFLRRELGYALALPDDSRGWILRAAARARSLRARHSFDFVIATGPPHGAHVAGAFAAGSTPLILDLRDPWLYQVQRYKERNLLPSRLSRWIQPRLAAYTYRRATAVICNTLEFARELQRERPWLPVRWLPNGVDADRLPQRPEPAGLSICHIGTLYAGRDLGPVIRALRSVVDRRKAAGSDWNIRLRLAGAMEASHRSRFLAQLQDEGAAGQVDLLGLIPQAAAIEILCQARLSLVLAQDQKLQVPAKLYESIGLGIPTLVIAGEDSASYEEGLRLGARVCRPGDVGAIAAVIEDTMAERCPARTTPLDAVDYAGISLQLEALLRDVAANPRPAPDLLARRPPPHGAGESGTRNHALAGDVAGSPRVWSAGHAGLRSVGGQTP